MSAGSQPAWKAPESDRVASGAWKAPDADRQAAVQSQDGGFFATLGKDIADAPRHFMDFISGHPVASTVQALQDLTAARKEHQQRAADAYHNGDYKEAFHQLMFSIPVIGPPAGAAADEMQAGKTGEGAAHAVEALAPWIAPELSGEGLARVGSAVRGVPAAVAGKVGELAGKVADVATSPVTRDIAGVVSPRAAHVLSLAGRMKKAIGSLVDAATPEAEAASVEKYSGSRYEQTPQQFGTAAASPATPGRALAESRGLDWEKLKPEDQATLEAVARAQANAAAQPARPPSVAPAPPASPAPPAPPAPAPQSIQEMIQAEIAARSPQPQLPGRTPLRPPLAPPAPPPPESATVPPANAPRVPLSPPVGPATPQSLAEAVAPPPARTLPQVEAAMAQKAPAPLEPPTSQYTSTGEKKSPELRAAEITGSNVAAKAQRFVQALHDAGVTSSDARSIPVGRLSVKQIEDGGVPGWGNVTDDLVSKGVLKAGENPPSQSIPEIVKGLKKLEAQKIAAELADEMKRSGTIK